MNCRSMITSAEKDKSRSAAEGQNPPRARVFTRSSNKVVVLPVGEKEERGFLEQCPRNRQSHSLQMFV